MMKQQAAAAWAERSTWELRIQRSPPTPALHRISRAKPLWRPCLHCNPSPCRRGAAAPQRGIDGVPTCLGARSALDMDQGAPRSSAPATSQYHLVDTEQAQGSRTS